jgi:hypothetical protein
LKKLLELLCGVLAGAALFAIMVLTFFDVLGRKIIDRSITGSLEMTELLMVIVIFAKSERQPVDGGDAACPGIPDVAHRRRVCAVG